MVTEMEWKCCHGYSGDDCNDGRGRTTGEEGMVLQHFNPRTHNVSHVELIFSYNIFNSAVFCCKFLYHYYFLSSLKKNSFIGLFVDMLPVKSLDIPE